MTAIPTGGMVHPALFYDSDRSYLSGVGSFLREGLAAGEPALVAVPAPKEDLLRSGLNGSARSVAFIDMTELGRNPSRIIPEIRRFTDSHHGRRTRFVGEPIWAGRSQAEIREATRHEALLNLAFDGTPTAILCPYDTLNLSEEVLADARCTHPELIEGSARSHSPEYRGDALARERSLPSPPPGAEALLFDRDDLKDLRSRAAQRAAALGLDANRVADLTLAVTEAAANSVVHAGSPDAFRIWQTSDPPAVVCEISDGGRISDRLAGRRRPDLDAEGGRGLWLINHLCDLVELHTDESGTTIRLHLNL